MMKTKTLRIATRKSPLALWQAEHIKAQLLSHHPDLTIELLPMTTQGDQILNSPLAKIGGKGLFVKELEQKLLDGDADIAVHSMKDVPAQFPDGLTLTIVDERADPRDVFIATDYTQFDDLPIGSRVGTSSLRRQCQLMQLRPDLQISSIRGNVGTRLKKLDDGQFDALIMASAGLLRLNLSQRITHTLETDFCLPAVGQGALGIEYRENNLDLQALLAPLQHKITQQCVTAERAMNARLNGGCQVPIAGHAIINGQQLHLQGLVGEPDGSVILRAEATGSPDYHQQLGEQVANDLLRQGADKILQKLFDDH